VREGREEEEEEVEQSEEEARRRSSSSSSEASPRASHSTPIRANEQLATVSPSKEAK
jgi:hypothetical protein